MAIRFLTDSTADILPEEAARRGLAVVPLKVIFGDDAYRDGIDLDHPTFYKMLGETKALPTTSQPTPDEFLTHFERAKEQGDSLICLLLSSKLSGTVQSARIAADLCGYDQIYIIDSEAAIIVLRALLDLGEKLRDEGKSAPEIVEELERVKKRWRVFGIVDTLDNLHKGGRLPASTAIAILAAQEDFAPSQTMPDVTASAFTIVWEISRQPPPCRYAMPAPAPAPALTAPQ